LVFHPVDAATLITYWPLAVAVALLRRRVEALAVAAALVNWCKAQRLLCLELMLSSWALAAL
jgi:hypothetical protein